MLAEYENSSSGSKQLEAHDYFSRRGFEDPSHGCFALFFAFVFEGDLMAASRRKSRWEAHLYHCMLRT
jgi:hypothetical protein